MDERKRLQRGARATVRWMIVLGLLAVCGGEPRMAIGQLQFGQSGRMIPGQFVEPPRALRGALENAERAIESRAYGDAVYLLGDLLVRQDADVAVAGDYFFDVEQPTASESFRTRVLQMLKSLPASGRQLYETRYGPVAEKALSDALATGDPSGLADVVRRYPLSIAGVRATMLLAGHELAAGRALSAALLLRELEGNPTAAEEFRGRELWLQAAAWFAADRAKEGERVLSMLDRGTRVRVGEQQVEFSQDLSDAQALASQLVERGRHAEAEATEAGRPSETRMAGGGPARRGEGGAEQPNLHMRWKVPTTSSSHEESLIGIYQRQESATGNWPIPTWYPIVVGDTVVARTTQRVIGIDLQTGKRTWEYPWFSVDEEFTEETAGFEALPEKVGETLLAQRIWNDTPYGQITSDGQRVFLLSGLEEVQRMSGTPFNPLGVVPGAQSSSSTTNTLVALELASEGKLLWTIDGASTEIESLSGAFFLGPPLPLDGRLYQILEVGGDTYVACLDARNGSLLWQQHLVAAESGGVSADPLRRVVGAMPAAAEGVLVCPTGHGTVVAIDLITRSLRWGMRPGRMVDTSPAVRFEQVAPDNTDRWLDGTPTIADGAVVVTPPESDQLMCLDLVTGQPRWPAQRRDDRRYVGGVRDGRIVIVGADFVEAVDLQSGELKWQAELPLGALVSGRGAFGAGEYFVPTSANRVVAIDLETGELRESGAVEYTLGNLVAVRGQVISHAADSVSAAYGRESLQREIDARLAVNPDDLEALVRKGEIALEEGRLEDAYAALSDSWERTSENEEVRQLLVETMLEMLERPAPADDSIIERLAELVETAGERMALARKLVDRAIERGTAGIPDALDQLVLLSQLDADQARLPAANGRGLIDAEEGRDVTLTSWIASRVERLVQDVGGDGAFEESVAKRLGELVENHQFARPLEQRRFLREFGSLSATLPVRLSLVRRLIGEDNLLAAERTLLAGLAREESENSQRQLHLLLARVYASAGWSADAQRHLEDGERLGEAASDEELAGMSRQELVRRIEMGRGGRTEWPAFVSVDVESDQSPRNQFQTSRTAPRVLEKRVLRGEQWRDWQVSVSGQGVLALIDPHGSALTQVQLGNVMYTSVGPREAYFDGGLLVVLLPGEMVVLDLFRLPSGDSNAVLWREAWRAGSASSERRTATITSPLGHRTANYLDKRQRPLGQLAGVFADALVLRRGDELLACDPLSGDELWRTTVRTADGSGGGGEGDVHPGALKPFASGWEDTVFVSSGRDSVMHFDATDGRLREVAKLPEDRMIWASTGRYALMLRRDGGQVGATLYDLATSERVLEYAAPGDVKGTVVGERWACMLQPDGALRVWDLREGRQVIDAKFHVSVEGLSLLHARQWQDQLLVMTDFDSVAEGARDYRSASSSTTGHDLREVAGPVMAFDLTTGKPRWEKPVTIPAFDVDLDAPSGSPILFFYRSERTLNAQFNRGMNVSVIAIDTRDGQQLDRREGLGTAATSAPALEIQIEPTTAVVRVAAGIARLVYRFHETREGAPETDADAADQEAAEDSNGTLGLFEGVD